MVSKKEKAVRLQEMMDCSQYKAKVYAYIDGIIEFLEADSLPFNPLPKPITPADKKNQDPESVDYIGRLSEGCKPYHYRIKQEYTTFFKQWNLDIREAKELSVHDMDKLYKIGYEKMMK